MRKKIKSTIAVLMIVCALAGCGAETTTITQESDTEAVEPVTYEAMMYDNQGNNFLNFQGNEFTITPNKMMVIIYNRVAVQ